MHLNCSMKQRTKVSLFCFRTVTCCIHSCHNLSTSTTQSIQKVSNQGSGFQLFFIMKLFCTTNSSRQSRTPIIKWRMASKVLFSSTKTWSSSRDSFQTKSLNFCLRSNSRRCSRSVTTLTISDKELSSSITICTHLFFSQSAYPFRTQVYPSSYTLSTSLCHAFQSYGSAVHHAS